MKKPFYHKPSKPVREVKPSTKNPTIEFAMMGDMITRQEYEEAYKGNVSIPAGGKTIMNVNAPLPNFPTGTRQNLYPGRGKYLTAKNFLEM